MSTAAGKKIAIVTGSALGLGYELARQLIAKGWFVAGTVSYTHLLGRSNNENRTPKHGKSPANPYAAPARKPAMR